VKARSGDKAIPQQLSIDEIAQIVEAVRRRGAAAGAAASTRRDPRRARLPDHELPVAAHEQAHRPLRRLVENRTRLLVEIIRTHAEDRSRLPLTLRLSGTDSSRTAFGIDETSEVAKIADRWHRRQPRLGRRPPTR